MPGFRRRDRALFVAVLSTGIAPCAASAVAAPPQTGGTPMPELIPPKTGGVGYGEPGSRAIVVNPTALRGDTLDIRGTLPGAARKPMILQRLDPRHGWRNVAGTRVRSTGRFLVRWRPDRVGPINLRAVLARRRAESAAGAPSAKVMVYLPAKATYFGPGLYGRQTACGVVFTPDLHGVAHKRLPCGTLVAILHAGREIVVPVIDRGPFNGSYSWDLTRATATALGFPGAGAIGYMRAELAASQ